MQILLLFCFAFAWIVSGSSNADADIDTMSCICRELKRLRGSYTFNETSDSYQSATAIDNNRCRVNPLVVILPLDEADIQLSMLAAQHCKLPFSTVSGGHGAAGYELAKNGVTISMSLMTAVTTDLAGVMTVQPGARFKKIYENTPEGWVPVGGGCPMVSSGGYYLGGGWSFLSRSYGLAVDSLLSVTTVLANSSIIIANATSSCTGGCADLWWASRGGGGGNFGVVSSYSVQLQKALPTILIGELCWKEDVDVSDLSSIWDWLMDAYPTIPYYLQIDPGWLPLGLDGARLFCFTVICNHDDETKCRELIDPVASRDDLTLNTMQMQPYLTWQLAPQQTGGITAAQHGYLYLTNLIMPHGSLTSEVMEHIQRDILASPSPRNIVISHMGGGAIQHVPSNATAFPHRDAQFVLQIKAIWEVDTEEERVANMDWVRQLSAWLEPFSTGGSYVNYMDPLLNDWARRYYGANLQRLSTIKRAVDPDNFFSFNQSIPLL